MEYEIKNQGVGVDPTLEKAIQHKTDKMKERLKRFHPDVAKLDIRLDHNSKDKTFECSLHLNAMKDILHAKKSAPELRVAVDKSFEAMMKEVDHYRAKINKSNQAT